MKKLFFSVSILLTMIIQASGSDFKRTDSSSPTSKIGKRKRTPEPSTPQSKPCAPTITPTHLELPENPSAPIKNHFLHQYESLIKAFIAANPDKLVKHTFSIEYKKSNGAMVTLTMRRGPANLQLTHRYLPEETQNLIETAQLCGDLTAMTVDDSILQVSKE